MNNFKEKILFIILPKNDSDLKMMAVPLKEQLH